MTRIPRQKQYEHKTLFFHYYKDLNGEWTRCSRFSQSDLYHSLSWGDRDHGGGPDYHRNSPWHHYRRETKLSNRDFILKRVLLPVYAMAAIILILLIAYVMTHGL